MKGRLVVWLACIMVSASSSLHAQREGAPTDSVAGLKAYEMLGLHGLPAPRQPKKPLVIAVVDDGFRLTHQGLEPFIYRNPEEMDRDLTDNDGNGYIDDVKGYDVSDLDNDVSIPAGQETEYFHGTMIAGVIVRVVKMALPGKASDHIKILPVKALSSTAAKNYIVDGYKGIEYAVKMNADIIVCAWSGGQFDPKYKPIFDEAARKGIMIIGSAGNFYSPNIEPPAILPTVYCVAAVDSNLRKIERSNYGEKVDLVASGDLVYAPHPVADNAWSFLDGTSSAAALVAGCAAVVKLYHPKLSPQEVVAALKNSARSVDGMNTSYTGKLGAGLPSVKRAVTEAGGVPDFEYLDMTKAEGEVFLGTQGLESWALNPAGGVKGFWFYPKTVPKAGKDVVVNFIGSEGTCTVHPVNDLPEKIFIPGGSVEINLGGKNLPKLLVLSYQVDAIDSSTLYCSGTMTYTEPEGIITDRSNENDYANRCDCKFQIIAPEGKRVRLEFDQFDTQAKVDFVHIFEGTSTIQEYTTAMFSGPDLPPVIVSRYHEVLIWFVTDATITGKGWRLKYSFTDDPPSVSDPGE